jgi:hypothetical protein
MAVVQTSLTGLLKIKHFRTHNPLLTSVYYYDNITQGVYSRPGRKLYARRRWRWAGEEQGTLTPAAKLPFRLNSVADPHRFSSNSDGKSPPFSSISNRNWLTFRIGCNSQKTKHGFNSNRNSNRPFAISKLLNFLPVRPPHQPSRLREVMLMCRVAMSLIGHTSQARWITQTEL